jgi:hypothetical protein
MSRLPNSLYQAIVTEALACVLASLDADIQRRDDANRSVIAANWR